MKTDELQSKLVAGILSGTANQKNIVKYTWQTLEMMHGKDMHRLETCHDSTKADCDKVGRCRKSHHFPNSPDVQTMYRMCRKIRIREFTLVEEADSEAESE